MSHAITEIQKNSIIQLKITDIGFEGKAIARTPDDFVVFVDNAVPGDIINAKIKKIKKNFAEAENIEIIEKSDFRTEPECEYFGTCNGCKMQNIKYPEQLEIKRKNVLNSFQRIGGFADLTIPPVIGSEYIYFYRNKLEFSFSANRWLTKEDLLKEKAEKNFALGFHIPNFIDKILDINKCYLQSDISNNILNTTREFFKTKNETIYSTKTNVGYLRFLVIRQSPVTNEILVNLITGEDKKELIKEFGSLLKTTVPQISTFVNSVSTKKAQVAIGEFTNIIFGNGFIFDKIGDYRFKITPNSFFQTNTIQAKRLFEKLVEAASFRSDDNILDLYCGCGAISLFISKHVNKVTGVELSGESIESAKENAAANNVGNCDFITRDVKDFLEELIHDKSIKFNKIILDPPRSGLHPKIIDYLLELRVNELIYVSCNPSTQARDIKLLGAMYNITYLQPVDMFPHTFHTENICRLELKQ